MKKFASSVLYVLSIVVAVGIGMFQVGGTEIHLVGSADSDCKQGVKTEDCDYTRCGTWSTCESVTPGTGADSCEEKPNVSCYDANATEEYCRHLNARKSDSTLTYSECGTGG